MDNSIFNRLIELQNILKKEATIKELCKVII